MAQTHKYSLDDFRAIDPEGGRGGRWLCPAPECSAHTDPRRHRSVSMRSDDGRWNCKRCHAQGQCKEFWKEPPPREFVDFKTRKARERQAARRAVEESITKPRPMPSTMGGISPKVAAARSGTLGSLAEFPKATAFLATRGFVVEDVDILHAAGVRFAPDFARSESWSGAPAIVFPVRDAAGKFVAVQGRFLNPRDGGPKALTLGPRSLGVFSTFGKLTRDALNASPVAICEAPLDALALAVCGVHAIALCGCSGVPRWLIENSFGVRYLLAFDADEAGDRASVEIGEELKGAGGIVKRLSPDGAKDWAELLRDAPEALIRQVKEIDAPPAPVVETPQAVTDTRFLGRDWPMPKDASQLPREYDPEGFAIWLEMVRPFAVAGWSVPSFEDFKRGAKPHHKEATA